MNGFDIKLGCGLVAIGRPQGATKTKIPLEKKALDFLEYAFSKGIHFFDTATAYGYSQVQLMNQKHIYSWKFFLI